ncbi:YdaS family helix-turn-helix protein [Marinobacterium stanieri]|uniref:YdaS family helix-turn-helix protein n=1 Tax=Marinobacterium stanieri TaxID=49186 RepID=UPI0009708E64|nr:YdaS family helix-turn-helix protein [Marinobacterium stanieri]
MNVLERDIQEFGPTPLAKTLGVSLQRINNWRTRGRVPAEFVLQYCEKRRWEVAPHSLRPDIYPNPDDGLPIVGISSTEG